MDPAFQRFTDSVRDHLRSIYGATPWVVCSEVLQGAVWMASDLGTVWDADVFALGVVTGVGPIDESVPHAVIGPTGATSMLENIRAADAALHDPPLVKHQDPVGGAGLAHCASGGPSQNRLDLGQGGFSGGLGSGLAFSFHVPA